MLFKEMIIFLVIMGVNTLLLYKAFKMGYNLRAKEDNTRTIEDIAFKTEEEQETEEELKQKIYLENLENYNGTGDGQIDV